MGDATFRACGARDPSRQRSEAGAPIRLADTAARCAIAAKHPLSTDIPCSLRKSRPHERSAADWRQAIDPPEKNREGRMRSVTRRRDNNRGGQSRADGLFGHGVTVYPEHGRQGRGPRPHVRCAV